MTSYFSSNTGEGVSTNRALYDQQSKNLKGKLPSIQSSCIYTVHFDSNSDIFLISSRWSWGFFQTIWLTQTVFLEKFRSSSSQWPNFSSIGECGEDNRMVSHEVCYCFAQPKCCTSSSPSGEEFSFWWRSQIWLHWEGWLTCQSIQIPQSVVFYEQLHYFVCKCCILS